MTPPPLAATLPRYTCDACRRRPGTWHARFADGVAFDVCDDCVGLVDDRVELTHTVEPLSHTENGDARP
jgi:hypothetical protein